MTVVAIEQPEDGGSYVLTGQAARDYLDGLALRRLREALSGEWHITIEPGDDGLVFMATSGVHATAATIAEAADKCREKLEAMG